MVPGPPSFIQGFLHVAAVPGLLPAWKKACCRATSTFILELIRRLPASLAGISEKAIANPTDESSVDNVTFHGNPSSIPRHGRRVGTLPDWLGIASLNRLAASDAGSPRREGIEERKRTRCTLSTQESALAISGLQNRQNDLLPLKDPNNTFKSRRPWANPAKTKPTPSEQPGQTHPQRLSHKTTTHHPLRYRTRRPGFLRAFFQHVQYIYRPLSHAAASTGRE